MDIFVVADLIKEDVSRNVVPSPTKLIFKRCKFFMNWQIDKLEFIVQLMWYVCSKLKYFWKETEQSVSLKSVIGLFVKSEMIFFCCFLVPLMTACPVTRHLKVVIRNFDNRNQTCNIKVGLCDWYLFNELKSEIEKLSRNFIENRLILHE